MRSIWHALIVAIISATCSTICLNTSFAQRLVDPEKVAPEYRVAAEKRRAEQIKMLECTRKANEAKILPRDRAPHIQRCLDEK